MSILNKLTEGIVNRDLSREGAAILSKWEKTGLLEGLDDYNQNTMAVLLENQAKELLRESGSMAGGDVEGFAAVAFPIVRRVFGGLLAQKLVSVQPMSLPSGLIFFMDFVKQGPNADTQGSAYQGNQLERGEQTIEDGATAGDQPSVYGGQITGRQILTQGVELDPEARGAGQPTPQFQDLVQGFSHARGVAVSTTANIEAGALEVASEFALPPTTDAQRRALQFDPDLLARASGRVCIIRAKLRDETGAAAGLGAANASGGNHPLGADNRLDIARLIGPDVRHVDLQDDDGTVVQGIGLMPADGMLVRRLSRIVDVTAANQNAALLTDTGANSTNELGNRYLELVCFSPSTGFTTPNDGDVFSTGAMAVTFAMSDNLAEATGATNANSDTLGALVGQTAWEMEGSVDLPEIAIKVDSVAVTAVTRKLKASWTPELAQDLNAYHNLDAEVELTGILSEQIALEIDQEILADLIAGATAGTLYWSRRPGLFVNRLTGADATSLAAPPDFTGSVSEWYETLVETINDVSADIHRKTLRGGANFLVCGPEVANILEFTSGFRASVTHDDDSGSVGAVQTGSISKKFDLHVDPYFPRNVILVGRKGSSFLESGYVYAPYVPLQTTPTIFHADDFTPRKAVMTRYGKKMVRGDMYGLVICRDLEG